MNIDFNTHGFKEITYHNKLYICLKFTKTLFFLFYFKSHKETDF